MSEASAQESGSGANKSGAGQAGFYRTGVLLLLTLVYTFNFVDRQIIGILSPAIKADLGLADWQLGILKGFAFAVLYTTLGIPIARLADRASRVKIISISLALWSGFTAVSGFCNNFAQLALARVGVGIGEAGGSPPAHSLISDMFPKEKRAGALAIYAMGIPIGIAVAYFVVGYIGESFSWRIAFVAVGLPGVVLAIILNMVVKEPPRGVYDAANVSNDPTKMFGVKSEKATLRSEALLVWRAAKHLLSIPTYRYVVAGATAISFSGYANATWIVDFYSRSHADFPLIQILFWLGFVSATAYALGTFLGGYLVDRYSATNRKLYGYIPALALLVNAPLFLIMLWHPSIVVSLALQFPIQLALGFYLGPSFALAQTLAPVAVRALSTAIFFFIMNMIALGLGPTTAGFLSSLWTPVWGEELALRVSLSVVSMAGLIAAWAFWLVGKLVIADWAKATGEGAL